MEPALLLQELPLAGGAEKLGLIGALAVAVGLLWRRLGEKDKQMDEKDKQTTDLISLQLNQTAAIEDVARALDDLRHEIRSMQP